MTKNIERALETSTASKITYEPVEEDYAHPVVTGWLEKDRITGEQFETHHPDCGEEVLVEVTGRTHSEAKVKRLLKPELTIFDWLKAKIWRLKRGIK